jgi:hypothetical protein
VCLILSKILFLLPEGKRVTHPIPGRSVILKIGNLRPLGFQLFRCVERDIGCSFIVQSIDILFVDIFSLRLFIGSVASSFSGLSSKGRPNQSNVSWIYSSAPGTNREESVSSIRRIKSPPCFWQRDNCIVPYVPRDMQRSCGAGRKAYPCLVMHHNFLFKFRRCHFLIYPTESKTLFFPATKIEKIVMIEINRNG